MYILTCIHIRWTYLALKLDLNVKKYSKLTAFDIEVRVCEYVGGVYALHAYVAEDWEPDRPEKAKWRPHWLNSQWSKNCHQKVAILP